MVRPPQPPAYFFVFDVSAQAVTSGMLAHVAAAVKKVVLQDRCLPGGERTQIGFLSYDTSVQYFNLSKRGRREDDSGKAQPQMLTVSDLVELFVPLPPDDLLVNLNEHLDTVETFLEALPTMFAPPEPTRASPVLQNESALGPALKAAFTILKPLGGKMLVFNSVLPSVPNVDGVLNPRGDNPRLMGTDGEAPLLRPQSNWYKDTAVEFSRAQISVDLFITNYNYVDVATLTDLPKYTAGNFFSFANFSSPVDGARLEGAVYHTLTRPTALEAVMRVRCTRGLRVTNFYGNFYIRGQDLLALPNCSSDSSYGFTIQHEDPVIPSNVLTIQSALLYTSTEGERRIRVITTVLPVVTDLKSVTNSIDATVFVSLLSKQGIDFALKNSPGAARNKLVQSCLDVIKTARSKPQTSRMPGAPPPGAFGAQNGEADHDGIPSHLALLPLMTLGMLKNIAFRGGTDVHPDERCSAMQVVSSMWVGDQFKSLLYPKMFRIDKMEPDAGSPFEEAADGENDRTGNHMPTDVCAGPTGRKVRLPQMLNLTVNALSSEGIYCLENGSDAYIWVGRQADPGLLRVLFGEESIENLNHPEIYTKFSESDIGERLYAILAALQSDGHGVPRAFIVREAQDQYLERKFLWHLVEDPAQFENGTYSYEEFMQFVEQRTGAMASSAPGGAYHPGPGRGPPGAPVGMMPPPNKPGVPGAIISPPQPGIQTGMMMPPPNQPGMRPPGQPMLPGGFVPPMPSGSGTGPGHNGPPGPPSFKPSGPPSNPTPMVQTPPLGGPPPPGRTQAFGGPPPPGKPLMSSSAPMPPNGHPGTSGPPSYGSGPPSQSGSFSSAPPSQPGSFGSSPPPQPGSFGSSPPPPPGSGQRFNALYQSSASAGYGAPPPNVQPPNSGLSQGAPPPAAGPPRAAAIRGMPPPPPPPPRRI